MASAKVPPNCEIITTKGNASGSVPMASLAQMEISLKPDH